MYSLLRFNLSYKYIPIDGFCKTNLLTIYSFKSGILVIPKRAYLSVFTFPQIIEAKPE